MCVCALLLLHLYFFFLIFYLMPCAAAPATVAAESSSRWWWATGGCPGVPVGGVEVGVTTEMVAAVVPPLDEALLLPAEPVLNLLAGQPYLLLLRCLSMSHLLLKAFPQEGHLWVPRWM